MIQLKWCYYILLGLTMLFIGCRTKNMVIPNDYKEPKESINSNNKIYKEGVKVRFDYYFIQDKDTFKCNVLNEVPFPSSQWEMVNLRDTVGKKNLIDKIDLEITGGLFFEQTGIKFDLLSPSLKPYKHLWSETGLIENEYMVWTHPNRKFQLNILEFNPFPQIRYPLKKGTTWTDTISPYPNNKYDKWIVFNERIDCISTYKITGKTKLKTNLGVLTCYLTEAEAVNPYGKGYLTSYFNEQYGFVKWDYTNIDGSRLIMNLIGFQEKTKDE